VQRAVLARELTGDVDLLIVSNPCFGLDVRHRGVRHGRRVRQQRRTSEGCPFRKADTAEFSSQFRQIFRWRDPDSWDRGRWGPSRAARSSICMTDGFDDWPGHSTPTRRSTCGWNWG